MTAGNGRPPEPPPNLDPLPPEYTQASDDYSRKDALGMDPGFASFEAEQSVLGAMLLDGDGHACHISRAIITGPEAFVDDRHRLLYKAMQALADEKVHIDHVTLREGLNARDELHRAGGLEYLAEIIDAVPSAANVEFHAKIVAECDARRRALMRLDQARVQLRDRSVPVTKTMDSAIHDLMLVAPNAAAPIVPLKQAVWSALEEIDRIWKSGDGVTGVSTGLRHLDALTHGWQPGHLVVVTGRPGMGKTQFMLHLLRHAAAECEEECVAVTLEMPTVDLVLRLLCAEANHDMWSLQSNVAQEMGVKDFMAAGNRMYNWPLTIMEGLYRASQIRSAIEAHRRKTGRLPRLVAVDYLGLMSVEGGPRRDVEIGMNTKAMARMAKDLGITVLLLHQISRASVRGDKPRRPRLSDLKDSGSVEEDSDVVVAIHPAGEDGEYDDDGKAEVLVLKNRKGPTGICWAHFNRTTGRWCSWDERERRSERTLDR